MNHAADTPEAHHLRIVPTLRAEAKERAERAKAERDLRFPVVAGKALRTIGTTGNQSGKGKPVAKLSRRQAERMMLRHGLRGQLTKRWVTRQTTSRAA